MNLAKNMYNKTAGIDVFSTYPRLITNERTLAMTNFIDKPKNKKFQDLTGMRFGRLTVSGLVGRNNSKALLWECKCDCGRVSRPTSANLKSGTSASCGCFRIEIRSIKNPDAPSKTCEYHAWESMKQRCTCKNHKAYHRYGGRGITICDRWLNSFANFLADMGARPSKNHSLDRINNELGYFKDNCRWATKKEQSRNTSVNKYITYNGMTLTVAEFADKWGIDQKILHKRIDRGWDIKEALEKPPRKVR